MKVLIVGGSGFLGKALGRRLRADGVEVVVLSRHASGAEAVTGDVRRAGLGLAADERDAVQAGLTHIVSCFGSVDWVQGPALVSLHEQGTRNVLAFARRSPDLQRVVHVSSILALGRSDRAMDNRTLDVGQRFRSWYEYAKFRAESIVRETDDVRIRTLRLGPLLGVVDGRTASTDHGLLAAVPALLRGYPLHLADRGDFPCYAADVHAAAAVVAAALRDVDHGPVWTHVEPNGPSLAEALAGVCAPWNVVPRIVQRRAVGLAARLLGRSLGIPESLLPYADPWVTFADGVADDLPGGLPASHDGFLAETGEALRATRMA